MISIVYAGNYKMFDGILISAISTVKYTTESINVFLITMDLTDINPEFKPISEAQRLYIEKIYRSGNAESRVFTVNVGTLYRKELLNSPNSKTTYTPYSFLRLFADRISCLPEKVLYLDTDTVINGDLSPLFHTDISGYEYGAALDYYGKVFMGYKYINSGVMLLNIEELRKTGLFRKAIRLCSEKRLFLPDQTAIHKLTKKKYILERKYNEQKRYNRKDTVIQHFTKSIRWFPIFHTRTVKPWQTEKVKSSLTHKYDDILDEYTLIKENFYENQ